MTSIFKAPEDVDPSLTSAYDYELPEELIAAQPEQRREHSRMMLIDPSRELIQHQRFEQLPQALREGDLLVFNDTQVLPARVFTRKLTGGKVELFVLDVLGRGEHEARWHAKAAPGQTTLELRCMTKNAQQLRPGDALTSEQDPSLSFTLVELHEGMAQVTLPWTDSALTLLERLGQLPLPPYIVKRRRQLGQREQDEQDARRYQTVYAQRPGAVAAPTAGLHFSQSLLDALDARGVQRAFVTLHVGMGTFKPVTHERITSHPMHAEDYLIEPALLEAIEAAKRAQGRIIAVGTTTARALEASARSAQGLSAGRALTDILIHPGAPLRLIDGLITNLHLPQSTLLAMVAAATGYTLMRRVYEQAVAHRYMFYSYGDGMCILPVSRG